jgi:hypothetical protein
MERTYINSVLNLLNITTKDEVTHHTSMKLQAMYINKLHRFSQETKVMSLPQTPSFVNNITHLL